MSGELRQNSQLRNSALLFDGFKLSKEKTCLVMWGIILHSYVGIIIKHYKDPYQTTSIVESKAERFFRGSIELPMTDP